MIVGQAKLERMLDKMADGGEDAVKRGIEQSAKLVQDAAKELAPVLFGGRSCRMSRLRTAR